MDVLVLRALKIGDLLVAVPALRGLRRAFPDDRIVLAAPKGLAQLVSLTGAVDELLHTPGLGELHWPGRPGLAVNMHGAGPQSVADLLATGPARLVTHRHPAFPDVTGPPWHEETHEVRRWCDLLAWHGIPADPTDLRLGLPPVNSVAPDAVVVHPGASVETRRWPAERFAEVARALTAAGQHVVVTGSTDEIALAETVARQADLPDDAVLAGHLDLTGLAALVAAAALVISNDTGIGHLATAYDTPSVVLFGPTPPDRWGPPSDRPRHRALWAGPDGLHHLSTPDVLAAAEAAEQA